MTSAGFPRSARLLASGDFRYVFEHTQHKIFFPGFLLLITASRSNQSRLGFVVGKKHVKLAVDRNRLKRVFRESFRLHRQNLPAVDMIALAIKGANQLEPRQLNLELDKAWRKLNRLVPAAAPDTPHTT